MSMRHDKLAISGMRCAACAQIIQYRLQQLPGIESVDLLYTSGKAEVRWQPELISLQKIVDAVVALGYRALPLADVGGADSSTDAVHEAELARQKKMAWWRLFIAGFAMMQVMMYAFPAWLEPIPSWDGDLTPDIDRLLKLASFSISVPVLLFSAWPFYRGALRDLKNRHIGMDLPVSLGIIATFIASVWATLTHGAVYYDSMIMFVFLLLIARMVQEKVRQTSSRALSQLTHLLPPQAQLCRAYPQSQQVETVLVAQIKVGDVVLIVPGAQIPVDGVVIDGSGDVDEALMTGESRAVLKQPGSRVIAGAINLSGRIFVRAEKVADATQLSHLVGMMEQAANQKPPLVALADQYASHFLLAVMLLALASGLIWWQFEPARALPIALTVLVITCPCALSLATPAVMAGVIGRLAKRGVLVVNGRAIEGLAKASHFVFDKTGTLTEGKLVLEHIEVLSARLDLGADAKFALLQLSAAMAGNSLHPVARALAASASKSTEQMQFSALEEIAGQGLQAIYLGKKIRLGSLDFVQALAVDQSAFPQADLLAATSLAALGDEDGLLAIFQLRDSLRPEAQYLVRSLQAAGKQVWVLSGDRAASVAALAQQLQIPSDQALAALSPAQKYAHVMALQQGISPSDLDRRSGAGFASAGRPKAGKVVVVGDGMNDGPVLSLADVSIAMGQGAPMAQVRSDVVLMSSHLGDLQNAWQASRLALRLIQQNMMWALGYNLVAIPMAVLGWLAPWHAALGMSLSSLLVVLNSLRVMRAEAEPASVDMPEAVPLALQKD